MGFARRRLIRQPRGGDDSRFMGEINPRHERHKSIRPGAQNLSGVFLYVSSERENYVDAYGFR